MKTALFSVAVLGMAFLIQAQDAKIDRGKYLVEEVGKCGDCHTPKNESGEPDATKTLKGATLGFAPIGTIPKWHKDSPDITPAGKLWLKPEDAEAVVSYLETLK